nr:C595 [uncultured bacterium]
MYLAQDTKLDRKVALKILPAEVATNRERMERFVREAKAAAALNHPNIAHVYEIGADEGTHFIAMEFIDGDTLREKIHREKAPLTKLLKYLNQVAMGLAKAHGAGIVHRDLKPENIMITRDDYAKVLDFGLAKLVEPQRGFGASDSASSDIATAVMPQHSTPGMVMGTIGYMSPEQASGRVNQIDHRSDIFSFGCILFEAATGKKAFEGKDALDSLHKIVHAPTPQLKDVNPLAPADLQRLVRRCLAKEPDKRYQSIKELAIELDDLQEELKDIPGSNYSSSQASPAPQTTSGASRTEEGFWVAVLPFKFTGSNTDIATLAEGLAEEIVTGLSRFSYLRVISRSSTLRHATQTSDLGEVGTPLGARYVIEGSLRIVGTMLRVSVQLVDSNTGAQLWAEIYNRQFRAEEIFALQDDLVPRIVSTVADVNGVLPRSMCEAVCGRSPDDLSPYEAVLRSFRYFDRVSSEELAEARSCLQLAVEKAPNYGDAWAMLALLCVQDYAQGFNLQSDSLKQGRAAAQRAVEAAPSNHLAYFSLAQAHFFQKELQSFRNAAERAVALNPMDGNSLAFVGELLTYVGDSERGLSLAARAKEINPNHPGWFWYADFFHAYRQGDYRGALGLILKANLPNHWGMHAGIAACAGQLGERETATKAVRDLLKLQPDFGATINNTLAKWFDPELCKQLFDGYRKAGLLIAGEEEGAPLVGGEQGLEDAASLPKSSSSLSVTAFEGRPAIAVLPFENLSNDPEQEYFADGLAEDLITRLSLWRSFPVIARNSSFIYKENTIDLKKVSSELGVRYLVQGSVRKANNHLRISAQLIDSNTAQNVWAKTFDRELDDIFTVQDEISEAIAVSLVGDLERAEGARVQRRAPESLEAWGLYQRALPLMYNFTPEDCAQARAFLERAVALDPHFSTALARLAELGVWEVMYEWTNDPTATLDTAITQARRAIVLDPLDAQARIALSFALMTTGDGHGALEESRHALELNPSMPFALAIHAYHRHIAGQPPEESIALVERALRLSPHDPVEWLFYDVLASAYLNAERFAEGFEAGRRLVALSPNYYWGYLWSAMNAVGLGQIAEARKLVDEARRVEPQLSLELALKCLGTMAPDVDRRFKEALRLTGLESKRAESLPPARTSYETPNSDISGNSQAYPVKTIAVLPFKNLSGDAEQEYFADGITEEIINALAQIRGLRVAGRSSSFSFKGRNEDLRSVGAKLNVATILEGTLRRSGDRLRITAQLIDAGNGYQLWSERYDRVMADVFALQDEIADTIAGRLQLSLGDSVQGQPVQPPTRDIGAYELYLKGRGLLYQRGLSIPKAIDCFTEAVALDPLYAQAWAGLADGYTTSGYSGFTRAENVMPRALEAARRALELDPNLAEAHNALANATLLYERKFDDAEREFKRALELNPNYPQAHAWYGLFYLHWIAGREREGREELLRLLQVDPLSGYAHVIVAFSDFASGRLVEAVEHSRRGVELDPSSYLAQWCHSVALKCNGQYEEAAAAAERALGLSGRHCWAMTTLTGIYAAWGKRESANATYLELKERREREYIQPSMLLEAAAAVGKIDEAIAFAQQALDDNDPLFVLMARLWPSYDSLRNNSSFLKIVSQLGLPKWNA